MLLKPRLKCGVKVYGNHAAGTFSGVLIQDVGDGHWLAVNTGMRVRYINFNHIIEISIDEGNEDNG